MKKAELHLGNNLEILKAIPDNSIDSIVTDPPYGLSQHKPKEVRACLQAWLNGEPYEPKGKGIMGKSWDAWVPGPEVWDECFRVLKPGGHALVFAGTRSMDLMMMALRLSGFELRDSIGYAHDGSAIGAPLIAWSYGSGFPKSRDIGKAIDKEAGAVRDVVGMGKGKGGENLNCISRQGQNDSATAKGCGAYGHGARQVDIDIPITAPATPEAKQWQGWGSALKPAWEPIILIRKPIEGTIAENVLQWGTGGINVDGCRIDADWKNDANKRGYQGTIYSCGSPFAAGIHDKSKAIKREMPTKGRWPANVIHDGSPDVMKSFPGESKDSEARFFYCSKASRKDRNEGLPEDHPNKHPTVKPTSLMEYLCRLITPPQGIVLDPFMGSGSTGKGAINEGFRFIGIEQDKDSFDTATLRIDHAIAQAESKEDQPEQTSLFPE